MGTPVPISLVIWGPPQPHFAGDIGIPDRSQDLDAIEALTKKCSRFLTAERGRSKAPAGEDPGHKLGYSNVTYMRRNVHTQLDKSDLLCAERVEFATVLAVQMSWMQPNGCLLQNESEGPHAVVHHSLKAR